MLGHGKYVLRISWAMFNHWPSFATTILCLCKFFCLFPQNKQFYKDNGLSAELVHGCKNVLRERQVLKRLMNNCESIAMKMNKNVTQVIGNGMGSTKQPSFLNSKWVNIYYLWKSYIKISLDFSWQRLIINVNIKKKDLLDLCIKLLYIFRELNS